MKQSNEIDLLDYLPPTVREKIEGLFFCYREEMEEIRLRANSPLALGMLGETCFVTPHGGLTNHEENAYRVSSREVQSAFHAICDQSVYAHMEEIRQGFLTLKGGHRVGICGKAVTENGVFQTFREISSLNFRIAHEHPGCADGLMERILTPNGVRSTLLISPPQGGKTTILRDVARQISNLGYKVGIADDRGEIAAMYQGVLQNDVGAQTDVIENMPKALAIEMLLRTMAPHVMITDEIACENDVRAICVAHGTGVHVVATTHGSNAEEVQRRKLLRPLFENQIFEQMILIERGFASLKSYVRTKAVLL